jgi:hypothetical protein
MLLRDEHDRLRVTPSAARPHQILRALSGVLPKIVRSVARRFVEGPQALVVGRPLSLLKTPISLRLLMLQRNGSHAATMYKAVGISGCEPPQPQQFGHKFNSLHA